MVWFRELWIYPGWIEIKYRLGKMADNASWKSPC